jgi:chlorobactene glucosyltransferase
MKKNVWLQVWPRLLLWSHVIGVIGFYLALWIRTSPGKNSRVKVLPPSSDNSGEITSCPFISIVVPARDEERNIRRCIESLLAQNYDDYEVIVVDDGSTDETAHILAAIQSTHAQRDRLRVLHLHGELPIGWAGKPHALHMGVREARGEWLLFTDADTWHTPNALRSSIAQALVAKCDMLTLSSTQELPSFWDRTLMPMAYLSIGMLYPPRSVNNPHSKVAVANGQYILIRCNVYTALGGYARAELRGTVLDDRDLAYTVKTHRYKLLFMDGNGLVHVRMYQSFSEIWRGWRKNAYLGNRGGCSFVLLELVGLPMVSIVPFLLPFYTNVTCRLYKNAQVSAREANIATAIELTPLLAYRAWLNRKLNVPWYYMFTHPLAGAVFVGILGQSTWRIVTHKGVDWRGRQYHNNVVSSKQTIR